MNDEVRVLESDEGFAVWVPGLPGCASQGATEQEALANIVAAIEEYLAALKAIQREDRSQSRTVTVQMRST